MGLARIVAGGWFILAAVSTLRQYHDLLPQAERLFGPDSGTTGAPVRSLLMLVAAVVLVLVGLMLVAKGVAWMRRVALPPGGPSMIERDEVIAVLGDRRLPAFAEGPTQPYWPLRRWLADELADLTWWQRENASTGVRAFVRTCGAVIALAVFCLSLSLIATNDLLGPFPTSFVILLPFVTAIWAVLGLMLLGSIGPRVEAIEFPVAADGRNHRLRGQAIESRPIMLARPPAGIGLTLGATGVAVQCLMIAWWNLSPIDYPLQATSIIRHAGSIVGGIIFFVLGGRMVAAARSMLLVFRYESMLVLIDDAGPGMAARAAAVRTESLGLTGPRHVVAAVGASYVRDAAEKLVREWVDSGSVAS